MRYTDKINYCGLGEALVRCDMENSEKRNYRQNVTINVNVNCDLKDKNTTQELKDLISYLCI